MPAIIDIKGLTKAYGKTQALKGIDLTVNEGEVYGFIGMNGAGKSTTIRILLGLLRKDGGEAKLFGSDPFKDAVELHRRLAYVPSEVNPWPNLSGGEVIDLLSSMRGKVDNKRRSSLISRFQFDPSKKCHSYSKGNRQKIALISALVSDVDLYIFDEPTSGLDPLMETVFQACVRELSSEGKTVFLSSHILNEVEKLCSRISVIRDGKIVESGSMIELQKFSRLIVSAECKKPIKSFDLKGVYGLMIDGHKASFSVDAQSLNSALKLLTEYETISLHCGPPELEDIFMHYYENPEATA